MTTTPLPAPTPQIPGAIDLSTVKHRQQAAWSAGDYAVIGTTLSLTGELLCEAVGVRPGQRILDVATGNGNAALAAARRGCDVIGIDYVPELLARARERAAAERLPIAFHEGDAENIPYPDASFDVALSTFGVMFTPDQERAARELMRVTRLGGKIGLTNWTPGSFIGQVFRTIGGYIPPSPWVRSPALWGTEERLEELFGGQVARIDTTRHWFNFRYRSPQDWLETFRIYYGPLQKAFEALDAAGQEGLEGDLIALLERFNEGGDQTLLVPSEYLEVVITRQ
jgi:ubiquinone/menaquinone biosynthesis C-methylase UbiE